MITIEDVLRPEQIELNLKSGTLEEAILQVATKMRGDHRILDWTEFYEGLNTSNPAVATGSSLEMCIPHVRTDAVSAMVMGVGRARVGIKCPQSKQPLHFIFVIGVPKTMASDYLRIVGSLARVLRDPDSEQALEQTGTAAEFVSILSAAANRL